MRERRRQAGEVVIRLADLGKSFGSAAAVSNVTLDLLEGEFFCLLGPSGCGKSTLLRLLAGFERPDAGRIELDGRDLAPVPPHRRPLNIMVQSYALFPHLTVAGNVAYGAKRAGLGRREIAARVAEMLRLVGLESLDGRYPAQLSGGQQQRVALARALARRPRVLLLDEPLGALDRALRERTQAELKDLQARLGTTFVMVTHDQDEAMAMADRIGIMDGGRLVQVGTPREVYGHPCSRFVAGFIGAANVLDGRVADCAGPHTRIVLAGGQEVTAAARDPALAAGMPGGLVVRPDRITVHPTTAAPPAGNVLHASVADAVFLGGTTAVRAMLPCGAAVRVTIASPDGLQANPGPELRPGEPVTLCFPPEAALALP